jgi:hypothetical protein
MLFPAWVLMFMATVMILRGDPLAVLAGGALIVIGVCFGK